MTKRSRPSGVASLDARDLQILEIVQRGGRPSNKSLAQSIGLSLNPCGERLRRLEREGYIRGYRAVVDLQRIRSLMNVHIAVRLARHRARDFECFEAAVGEMPEIVECNALAGGLDYILHVVARDIAHYQAIMRELLDGNIGINRYYGYIVTKRIKESRAIPLQALIDEAPAPPPGGQRRQQQNGG